MARGTSPLSVQQLQRIGELTHLTSVGINMSSADDSQWGFLARLPKLKQLRVWHGHHFRSLDVFNGLAVEELTVGGCMGLYRLNKSEPDKAQNVITTLDHTIDRVRTIRTDKYRFTRNYKLDRVLLQPQYRASGNYFRNLKDLYTSGELSADLTRIYFGERSAEEFDDLVNDPAQVNNLIDAPAHADEVKRHRQLIDDWLEETSGQTKKRQRPCDTMETTGRRGEASIRSMRSIALTAMETVFRTSGNRSTNVIRQTVGSFLNSTVAAGKRKAGSPAVFRATSPDFWGTSCSLWAKAAVVWSNASPPTIVGETS